MKKILTILILISLLTSTIYARPFTGLYEGESYWMLTREEFSQLLLKAKNGDQCNADYIELEEGYNDLQEAYAFNENAFTQALESKAIQNDILSTQNAGLRIGTGIAVGFVVLEVVAITVLSILLGRAYELQENTE